MSINEINSNIGTKSVNSDNSGDNRSKSQKVIDFAIWLFKFILNTIIETFAVLACVITYPFLQTRSDPKNCVNTGDQNKDIPIILVHGYLHNSSGWKVHRWLLNKQGYKNVFTVDLGALPFGKSIKKYAEVLEARVNKIREDEIGDDSHITQFRLIGHSMGGLVASYYALKMEHNGIEIKDVITLDSPLKGTPLSYICFDQAAKEMRPNSPVITDLSSAITDCENIRFHHFGSDTDILVGKKSALNGNLANGERYRTFDGGHLAILFSMKVNRQIVNILDYIEP